MNRRPASPSGLFRIATAVSCFAILLSLFTLRARAQNPLIHHTVVEQHLSPPSMGREFWFTMMGNEWGNTGGKYMAIYITSPQNTTAYVQLGAHGAVHPVIVQAYKMGIFLIPFSWERESSGYVKDKAIHVWSNDADLTVYDMSHVTYTSDGSYIIPTIGWGTDYVVAGYAALYEDGFDDPSEFAITANTDNTTVTITPSTDLRNCPGGNESGDACSNIIGYPRGVPFTVTLMRGQSVQYLNVRAQNADDYDVTGTIIHSNNPVGISAGGDCPNIPANFPYCDHVEEMNPPIRTWAKTYYTTNFKAPPGQPPTHDYGLYLFISSKAGQKIYRYNPTTGPAQECIISSQYGIYWDELELAQKFYSDAPFLLVEYINSSTFPDNVNGIGDPAEILVNPREQYSKTVVFETPVSSGGPLPYTNYATIIVNKVDENKTYFDGQRISKYTKEPIDDTFDVYTVPEIPAGAHEVTGDDSGVGVYVYGYAYDESYGWAGSFGTGTFQSKDTVAPLVDTIGSCYSAFVHVTDSGYNPGGIKQSGLSMIRLDTDYNMAYIIDPDWREGSGADTGGYDMFVLNPADSAYLQVSVFDLAGNETTITSKYTPQTASIEPPLQNLGASIGGNVKYAYDTIINEGTVPFKFDELQLKYGNLGFTLDSGMTPDVLAVGEKRILRISFLAKKTSTVVDSIVFGNACGLQTAAVVGSGGNADFVVSSQDWQNELVPGVYKKTVTIDNLSAIPIQIDKGTWPDNVHFTAVDTFPFTVPATNSKTGAPGEVSFNIDYHPDANSIKTPDRTQGSWTSPQVTNADGSESIRYDSLIGNGIAPTELFVQDIDTTVECVQPGDTMKLTFLLADTGKAGDSIESVTQSNTADFVNLRGQLSSGTKWDPTKQAESFAPGATATITVDYPEPPNVDTTVTDSLVAINKAGDTIGGHPIKVTVHVVYRAGQVQPQTVVFGTVPYRQASFVTRSFIITNSTSAPLEIDGFSSVLGAPTGSYTITSSPGVPYTLPPDSPDSFMTVSVTFNDSVSFSESQGGTINIASNSCQQLSAEMKANVTTNGAVSVGYIPTPILSCDQPTNNDTIINTQPHLDSIGSYVYDTIESATWTSAAWNPNPNFQIPNVDRTIIRSGDSLVIPVTFLPGPAKGLVTYKDTLQVVLRNDRGLYDTLLQPDSGIAGTALISASSQFATLSGAAGNEMSVPVSIKVNTQGLNLPTAQLGITGIELTYVVPHPDLLIPNSPNPFSIDSKLKGFGWTSVPDPVPGMRTDSVIRVKLFGPALNDNFNTSTLGQLQFEVALDKSDNATPVMLQKIQLFTGPGDSTLVGSCIDTAVTSNGFSLILNCGDSTLRGVMSGQGVISFIGAATPDPVTGNTVTFRYANRGETNLTLAIYDVLGHKVAIPVDNVNHNAGAWQVSYNVSKLPSGTYTYRLSSSGVMGQTAISKQFVIQH